MSIEERNKLSDRKRIKQYLEKNNERGSGWFD